jgi:hypothetical protein
MMSPERGRAHLAIGSVRIFHTILKAGLRAAACGGRPRPERHDGHRGTGLAVHRGSFLPTSVMVACLTDELRSLTKYLSGEGPCVFREATA